MGLEVKGKQSMGELFWQPNGTARAKKIKIESCREMFRERKKNRKTRRK